MKCSIIVVLIVLFNVLHIQGHSNGKKKLASDYPLTSEISQNINFNSILEDINDFYKHKSDSDLQLKNPNVKAQLATSGAEANAPTSTSNTGTNNSNAGANSNGNSSTGGDADANKAGNNGNTNANANGNANANTNTDANGNTNADGKTTDGKTTDENGNDVPLKEGANKPEDDKEKDDEEEVNACGDRSSLGYFAFVKPISKSILVINSNFTIIWYYNHILDTYEYNFPQNNITFKLFYEEDANPNSWATAWKNPVFEKTIPLKTQDIQPGPVTQGGVKTYQYNWNIITNGDEGFIQNVIPNKKYKLRIIGDGKDTVNNPSFTCYGDGDIQPGSTTAFYIVDNKRIEKKYYKPIQIENNARLNGNLSIIMTFAAMVLVLYHYW